MANFCLLSKGSIWNQLTWLLLCNYAIAGTYPFQNTSLSWEERVDDLVYRLTLSEISDQLTYSVPKSLPSVPRLGIQPYRWDTECLRGYVNRNATAFPDSLGLAASFSRELLFNMSEVVSHEVRAYYNEDVRRGIYGKSGLSCFSPVINIMRHPLWGRNQETYGEDTYLSGELVTQYVRGLQGNHSRYVRSNAGCKHFAVYAGPEDIPSSRFSFDARVSERDLRMTFLPQFEACIKAGTYNVMCSYSSLNGVPSCANKKLLTDILRGEWNFTGYVVSDACALEKIVTAHHYLPRYIDAAVAAINAGCNLELTGYGSGYVYSELVAAVEAGLLTLGDLTKTVKPLFYTRMRLGEFDPPEMNPYSSIPMSVVLSSEHRELAIQAAAMSFVLLKNSRGLLPLRTRFKHLAIVGPMGNNSGAIFGTYAAHPERRFISTPVDGLSRLSDKTRFAAGCYDPACKDYDPTDVKVAVDGAELVVVCLGLGAHLEEEDTDRSELALPGHQLQLLKDAIYYSDNAPLLLLLFNGGPLDVTFAQESPDVDVIISCVYPAQGTGEALYRIVTMTGPHSVPAGRLPNTWPAQLHQVPPITDYNVSDGQTYKYLHDDPLFPFGYGLSYSQFHYSNLSLTPAAVVAGQNVSVDVTVTNRGQYEAEEVVQIYLSWAVRAASLPRWTLVGFDRVLVPLTQPQRLHFVVTAKQMSVWLDDATGYHILPGDMFIFAGGQQPYQRINVGSNVLRSSFTVFTD